MPAPDQAPETQPAAQTDEAAQQREGVLGWVDCITERELPLFAQNLAEISSVASARQSSAADLARAITMDISMSVRLLKIANSPVLNPQNRAIDSVSKAVVLMGFDAVRDLAFSLSLVTELHHGEGKDHVVELLAHAFHTATLAQALAQIRKDRCSEEVFVAGLLLNIGAMAFWSRPREEADAIEARLADGEPPAEAERAVLGFTLRELSRRLADEWRMSGLLRGALGDPEGHDRRCEGVLHAQQVAGIVEAHGWDSAEGKAALSKTAQLLGLPQPDVELRLREATREAGRMARRFGVHAIEGFLAPRLQPSSGTQGAVAERPAPGSTVRFVEADPHVELQAVRDVQALLQEKPDIDRLMRVALEGLHAGAGMDRAFFAMLSPDRNVLKARYAAGADRAALLAECRVAVRRGARNLFAILLQTGKVAWVSSEQRDKLGSLIVEEIDRWAAGAPFFAMPIFVRRRPVGLLYADRSASGRSLDDEAFKSFRFFGEQIAAGLASR